MTKQEFAILTKHNFVYLDGATGSNLMKQGMPAGVCPEEWILKHPMVIQELQKAYVEAGSNIVYVPTFTANRIKLQEYGLEKSLDLMIQELVCLSREAVDGKAYIAGDLTMTGEQLEPIGKLKFEELIDVYKEQINSLCKAGVDLLVVETMMSLQESRAALIAAKETCDLPVMVTMTFEADGRTLYGTDATTAAVVLSALGADAIGANCSTGPDKMSEIIAAMAKVTRLPIIAKPNAGLPAVDANGKTYYDMEVEEFVKQMQLLIDSGATILGGCCGTTPDYIHALVDSYGKIPKMKRESLTQSGMRYLSSERQTVSFSLEDNFQIVGERINPTGKIKLQEELRNGSFDMVIDFAEEQERCGAKVLDINMGMSGVDEMELMLRALNEVSMVTSLPLAIDSSHIEVVEAALRNYPGRALINSISLESEKFERLIPIAKKYGAMFILLPLSDAGLPKDLEEKKVIIDKIYARAREFALDKEDIIVDGLVTTVGANNKAALETLETIRYCKENGFATICGLSNISFGMPQRSYVNAAFLTMAIGAGLSMAIANPSQELLVSCSLASDLLLAKPDSDIQYIEYATKLTSENKNTENNAQITVMGVCEKLKEAVLKGNRKGISDITKEALNQGENAQNLLNEVLLPAINLVGDYFDSGKYFLPQLISSAEAMKMAIEVLEPLLLEDNKGEEMPVVVIATVEGDIHDIGKNLVALMLRNYGFEVIDLGKDVSKEVIISKARENNAQIICLSALMTTTMQRMKEVIAYAKQEKITAKIMIGGAVITQDYADEIAADGYSKDAAEAVKVAKKLLGI